MSLDDIKRKPMAHKAKGKKFQKRHAATIKAGKKALKEANKK